MYNSPVLNEKIARLSELSINSCGIDPSLYPKYDVKRGLRDISGKGVLAGLTEISEVRSHIIIDEDVVPCEGKLFYRGIDIEDIVRGFLSENRFGFEETCYLLLFGELPNPAQLKEFNEIFSQMRSIPDSFVRDIIMKAPSKDVMNSLARSVLTLYSYDENADDISIPNVLRQCLHLIASFPLLCVYSYQAYSHYHGNQSLVIHSPNPDLSTAENILWLLRPNSSYTELEAKILDIALVLHAEHGGGNNSTFTTHVVSSSGTDTYSAISASLGSLKGPRHGGANIKVVQMFENIKENIKNWQSDAEISDYLLKLLRKQAFDNSGLIYGIGHAVYSLSDPRAKIFKAYVEKLAAEKGLSEEYELYSRIEKLAPEVIAHERKMYKGVSANVDFYSGFVYKMLELPSELYTPLFAVSRVAGWSAHRMEELINKGKIIRPAYKNVKKIRDYIPLNDR